MSESRSIEAINIGDRVRKDMGDIKGLAESMQRHGLLHPVVILGDGLLVAGHRRIAAAELLGWKDVPVTVLDVADLLAAERDENEARKDFTPTEAVAIGRLIEAQEIPKGEERRRHAAKLRAAAPRGEAGQFKAPPDGAQVATITAPKARATAAKAVGMTERTYARAKAVVAAAEKDPATFGDLPGRMDEAEPIGAIHSEMERRKAGANGRHVVHRKTHYPKPNEEMQRAVQAIDGICMALDLIELDELDTAQTKEWAASLKRAASKLSSISRRLNVEAAK